MKKILVLGLALIMTFAFAACDSKTPSSTTEDNTEESIADANNSAKKTEYPITIDNYGNEIILEKMPTKVVTAGPNCTELFIALGLQDYVIGNSCDNHAQAPLPEYEEAYAKIPELTFGYPTLEAVVSAGCEFLYAIDWVFDGEFTIEALKEHGITVYSNSATSTEELYAEIRDIGKIFGVEEKAEEFIASQEERIAAVQKSVEGEEKKTVFCYDSDTGAGVYTAGGSNIMTEFIEMAGGENLAKNLDKAWVGVSLEEIIAMDPDTIIIHDYDTPTADEKIAAIKGDPILSQLEAVKNEKFVVVPLEACFPGSRTADCVEIIAKGLHG
jgi:ABC-type Fe3+-hydroxamate transport system, periplasmic component